MTLVREVKEGLLRRKLLAAVAGGIVLAAIASPAMADSRSINLQPGFTNNDPSPRAAPGSATGYVVPYGANGGQAGANWTSRSGNFNAGGYIRGDMNGGYTTGAGVRLGF
jgi:hypothetical protein